MGGVCIVVVYIYVIKTTYDFLKSNTISGLLANNYEKKRGGMRRVKIIIYIKKKLTRSKSTIISSVNNFLTPRAKISSFACAGVEAPMITEVTF